MVDTHQPYLDAGPCQIAFCCTCPRWGIGRLLHPPDPNPDCCTALPSSTGQVPLLMVPPMQPRTLVLRGFLHVWRRSSPVNVQRVSACAVSALAGGAGRACACSVLL